MTNSDTPKTIYLRIWAAKIARQGYVAALFVQNFDGHRQNYAGARPFIGAKPI
jgi:hypothetical protein